MMPEGLVKIGKFAFQRCTALTSIALPQSLIIIGDGAFCGCSALTTLSPLPDQLSEIGEYAFDGCPFDAATRRIVHRY